MKVIFAGTPDFAVASLEAIYNSNHQILGVWTQPDKASGRGKKIKYSAVKEYSLNKNLTIYQPNNFNDKVAIQQITNLNADVMVVVAYGQILPIEILNAPRYGCLNIHASLLPKWRGAAPIQRAILAGDEKTGINIIQMNQKLDTGDILFPKTCKIKYDDTSLSLHNKLMHLGAEAILYTLNNLNNLVAMPQKGISSYANKLKKNEAFINWDNDAWQIFKQIKAFNPYPIAQTYIKTNKFTKQILRIIDADIVDNNGKNKEIVITKDAIIINTKNQALSLKTVQLAGKKATSIKDFNNSYQLTFIYNN